MELPFGSRVGQLVGKRWLTSNGGRASFSSFCFSFPLCLEVSGVRKPMFPVPQLLPMPLCSCWFVLLDHHPRMPSPEAQLTCCSCQRALPDPNHKDRLCISMGQSFASLSSFSLEVCPILLVYSNNDLQKAVVNWQLGMLVNMQTHAWDLHAAVVWMWVPLQNSCWNLNPKVVILRSRARLCVWGVLVDQGQCAYWECMRTWVSSPGPKIITTK